MPRKIKKEEFSAEQGNMEIVPKAAKNSDKNSLMPGKNGNVFIGTLNLVANPVKTHLKNRHERFYKDSKFHLTADILFVLGILSLAAILVILWNFQPKAEIELKATLANNFAQSGQAETVEVEYKNNGKNPIKNAKLSFNFPKDFVLLSVWPQDIFVDQTNSFNLGDLDHGVSGKIKITGVPYGDVGSRQIFNYSLNYTHNNRAENTLGSFEFSLDSSALATDLTVPAEVFSETDFGGELILKNSGQADIEKSVTISFVNSPFLIKSLASEKATLVNNEINLEGLKAGEEEKIKFIAQAEKEGDYNLLVKIYLNDNGQKFLQQEINKRLKISLSNFKTEVVVDKNIIKDGEAVNYKFSFVNNETEDARDVTIYVSPSDSSLSLKNLDFKNSDYVFENNTVKLGTLESGAKGVFELEAILERKKINPEQEAGLAFTLNYHVGDKEINYVFYSPNMKILSDLQVLARGLYYSAQGDQLGIGPIPPAVDVPTRYWIFWEINNLGNELKDFAMTADLPVNVGWTNQKSLLAGDIRYGTISKKVVWNVDNVSRADGVYRAGFEVELIPSSAQVGEVPDILSNIKYSATDVFANAEISGGLTNITADLKDDLTASGKGTVVKINIVK